MNKKSIIIIASAVFLVLIAGMGYLYSHLMEKNSQNEEMLKLAEMDKKEMENEYAQFAKQYSEMKTQINNDSLIAQLDQEQQRTEDLLDELRRVKSSNATEITRLKKELATIRSIMRSYIMEIDSLNRLNQVLQNENQQVKAQYSQAAQKINNLTSEKENLSEQVAIASQLDATSISFTGKNKRNKVAKKIKDVKKFVISFVITKNVTAKTGNRTIYVRITKPTNEALTQGGTFQYENRTLEYSIKKDLEYTGEEQAITLYWEVEEFLSAGTYNVYVFSEGHMIGSSAFTFEK